MLTKSTKFNYLNIDKQHILHSLHEVLDHIIIQEFERAELPVNYILQYLWDIYICFLIDNDTLKKLEDIMNI